MPQPQQQLLPLEPQPPCPEEVQQELLRLWRRLPRWRQRYSSPQELLDANPDTAKALQACARQSLVQRQREWLRRQPTTRGPQTRE